MVRHKNTILKLVLASVALGGPVLAEPLIDDEIALSNDRLTPGLYPAAPMPEGFEVPAEPGHPPFEIDWSIGLKGSYIGATDDNIFVTTVTPAFSATHQGVRSDLKIDGSASLAKANDGSMGVTAFDLDLGAETLLDRDTKLTGLASLGFAQDLPATPGLNPLVTGPAAVVTGSLGGGAGRRFGQFNFGLNGTLARTIYGTTTRSDTGVTDNSSQNVWEGDATLRLGLQASPIIEVFGEASLGRDWFDQASAPGIRPDATSHALRAGIAGKWNSVWEASASLGVGQHDFDAAALGDITTRLYDASLTYTPNSTLNLTAALSTKVTPTGADTVGTARVAHVASADLGYTVNSWLRLRASGDWGYSWLEGTAETETSYGLGAGADYKLNSHTAVSADYGFAQRDNSVSGVFGSHTVSLGLNVKR